MQPDPISLLAQLGLGQYAAGIVALAMCTAYVVTWFAPLLPAAPTSPVALFFYNVVQKIAGNVGNAKNANAPPANTVIKVPTLLPAIIGMMVLTGFGTLISACAIGSASPVQTALITSLTTAQQDAQKAINLYGISKGIAEVAELALPTLAPGIDAAIAVADPLVAKAQVALNDASADATALEALVQQITTQANSLTVTSASVIKVVPSTPAPAS